MKKLAAWFDIPVSDIARAIAFYEHVTSQKLKRMPVGEDRETALFEADGCLFLAPEDKPCHMGPAFTLPQILGSTIGCGGSRPLAARR